MKKFDFGANLRKIRTEKGISQEAIANYLGVSQKTYSRIENNKTRHTSDQTSKIASFYGVPLTDLGPNPQFIKEAEFPKKEKKFLGLHKRLFIEAAVYLALVPSSWEFTRALCVEFKASENTIAAAPRLAALAMAIFIWYAFKKFNKDKITSI